MKYAESSIIVRVYTELFGLQSYIIRGARGSKKARIKANIFQPLTLVEMSVYHREKEGLQKIRDIRIAHTFSSIHQDVVKSSVALFLAEMLYKSIQEEEANLGLFEYLNNAITVLDLSQESCSNFHIYFLLQLSRHLGFYPRGSYNNGSPYFDMENGTFCASVTGSPYIIGDDQSKALSEFLNAGFENYAFIALNVDQRKELLNTVISFYQLHLPNINEVVSHQVLEEVIR